MERIHWYCCNWVIGWFDLCAILTFLHSCVFLHFCTFPSPLSLSHSHSHSSHLISPHLLSFPFQSFISHPTNNYSFFTVKSLTAYPLDPSTGDFPSSRGYHRHGPHSPSPRPSGRRNIVFPQNPVMTEVPVQSAEVTAIYVVALIPSVKLTLVDNVLGTHLPLLQVDWYIAATVIRIMQYLCVLFVWFYSSHFLWSFLSSCSLWHYHNLHVT